MKTSLTSALLLTLGLCAGTARAADLHHLHDLAETLESQSAATAREIYYHLRGAPDYAHLYTDSLELYRQTQRLHTLVDAGAAPQVLDRQIHAMEETQKHIAELVEAMEAQNQQHGHIYHVHVSQFHLERVCKLVTQMGETIEHMHSDVTALLPSASLPLPPGSQLPLPPSVSPAPQPVPLPPSFQQTSRKTIQLRTGGLGISLRVR